MSLEHSLAGKQNSFAAVNLSDKLEELIRHKLATSSEILEAESTTNSRINQLVLVPIGPAAFSVDSPGNKVEVS